MIEYTQARPILFPAQLKKSCGPKMPSPHLKSAIVYDNYMTDHDAADLRGK